MSLAKRLRDQRKITVSIGDIKFYAQRATVEQFSKYAIEKTLDAEVARIHVSGWENVRECDLISDGSKDVIAFDREAFFEAIGDKPEWYSVIAKKVLDESIERLSRKESNEKK